MKRMLLLAALTIALAIPTAGTAAAPRPVACGSFTCLGGGPPPCDAAHYTDVWFDGSRFWVCTTDTRGNYFWV